MTAERTGPGPFCWFHCLRLPQRAEGGGGGVGPSAVLKSQQAQEEERTISYIPRGVFTSEDEMTASQSGLCFTTSDMKNKTCLILW